MSEGPDETLHEVSDDDQQPDQDQEPGSAPSGAAAAEETEVDQDAGPASEPSGGAADS